MIRSFKCKETEKIAMRVPSRKLPQAIQQVALRKLRMLNNATRLSDLRVPPDKAGFAHNPTCVRSSQWKIEEQELEIANC